MLNRVFFTFAMLLLIASAARAQWCDPLFAPRRPFLDRPVIFQPTLIDPRFRTFQGGGFGGGWGGFDQPMPYGGGGWGGGFQGGGWGGTWGGGGGWGGTWGGGFQGGTWGGYRSPYGGGYYRR